MGSTQFERTAGLDEASPIIVKQNPKTHFSERFGQAIAG
jgi:hypothetical protein